MNTTPHPTLTHNKQLVDAADVVSVGYSRNDPSGSTLRIQLANGRVVTDTWPDAESAAAFSVSLADATRHKAWLFTKVPQWVATEFVSAVTYQGATDVRVTTKSGEAITDHFYGPLGRNMWIEAVHMSMIGDRGQAVQLAEVALTVDAEVQDGRIVELPNGSTIEPMPDDFDCPV